MFDDGFADYIVSYGNGVYRDNAAGSTDYTTVPDAVWTDEAGVHYASNLLLKVFNSTQNTVVDVQKVSADNNTVLPGAQFELYRVTTTVDESGQDQETRELVTFGNMTYVETGENGRISLGSLVPGNYLLKEVKAPAGYYLMPEEIYFHVGGGTADIDEEDTFGRWNMTGPVDGVYTLTVKNTTGTELPVTGGPGTTLLAIGGMALIGASLLYALKLKRMRERGGAC